MDTPVETLVETPQYRRGIRAWVTYDWANSAFTTTVITAVLPVYFASVAGATLPSPARATQLFSLVTSVALAITAIMAPFLGAYSDLAGAKKRLLALCVGIGAIATGALWLVTEGDWVLALVLFGIGRIAFHTGNVFYDSLLPSVARPVDQEAVSARGYAFGYLGGGLLLAANVAMVLVMPGDTGPRWAFVSVALWWVAFSLPLFRRVEEPPPTRRADSEVGLASTVRQTVAMLRSMGRLPDLRRFLIAYLIYNDGINVVIAVAALYGAELGFGTTELLLAVLLVQFTAGPYAIAFGRLASRGRTNRGWLLVFLVANIVLVPMTGIVAAIVGPGEIVGRAAPDYAATATAVGQGDVDLAALDLPSGVEPITIDGGLLGVDQDVAAVTITDQLSFDYVGRNLVVTHGDSPGGGVLSVQVDGEIAAGDGDDDQALVDTTRQVQRFGETLAVTVPTAGTHTATLSATGGPVVVSGVEVAPPPRESSLPAILGILVAVQLVAAAVAWLFGRRAHGLAERVDARAGIILALVAYVIIAVWGFFLDTVVAFWALAWLVSVVQGGSQALSRSLYATLVPESRAGEFFGLFSILSKFASFLSPLLFVLSVALFASSRPAVLSLAVLFLTGIVLLRGVDVGRGRSLVAAIDHPGDNTRE